MRVRLLATFALLSIVLPSMALGQTAYRTQNIIIGPTGQAQAGASIAVCTHPANTSTQPCTPLATLYPDSTATNYSISAISCSAFVVTVTTSTTNFIPVGQWVTISGVLNASFNGVFQVTSHAAGTFTYAQACTNGSSSGGTVSGANPTFSNGLGNYFYYALPGTYTVQIYAQNITTQIFPDQTVTYHNVFPAGLTATSITDTGLTVGNCVQVGAGGLLVTVSGPCGTSSGTVTVTGSPSVGNFAVFSGPTSITNLGSQPQSAIWSCSRLPSA